MKPRIAPFIILLLLALGGGYWYFTHNPQVWYQLLVELNLATPEAEPAGIAASGFIEVRQVTLAPEVSGRIDRLWVNEGDQVTEGQVVVEIDADLLDAQIAEAEAGLALAEAQLARVEAGARAEEIEVAQAALVVAQAQRDAAYQAWQDAILLRDNPQELDLQIAAARSQVGVMEHHIQQMVALKDAAELLNGLRERQVGLIEEGVDWSVFIPGYGKKSGHFEFGEGEKRQAWAGWNLATTDVWQAWVGLNQAIVTRDATQQSLDDLLALRANPQQAQVRVAQAEAAYRQAVAAVGVARANLEAARAGATPEQIDVARTGVDQAQAALGALQVQRQKHTLRAPVTGTVLERIVHQGENVLPGTTLFTLGNLDSVDLTIYVPEPDVGKVDLDQLAEITAQVKVDSFPDQTFIGQVVWVSDKPEYTPKNIQTKEERVSTVFAVKLKIPNAEHKLKPGMPADAVLDIQ